MTDSPLILFIEDQQYPVHLRVLARANFKVETAENAWRAYFLLQTRSYAGVILDLMIGVRDKKLTLEPIEEELLERIQQTQFCCDGLPPWVPGVKILELIIAGEFARSGNGPDLPVVVVSGVPTVSVQARVEHLLGDLAKERYFLKPVSPEQMVEALKKSMRTK